MSHYTIPPIKKGIFWFTTTPRNKQREVNQLCLLTKTLKKFISLNSKSPQCYVLPFFTNFCFSFFILSLSFLCLSPNIFSRSDISNPLTIMVWRFSHAYWALALTSWLFFFGLVVIFSSLLPAHATILNILCQSTSLDCCWYIYYMYLIMFTAVFEFSHLSHISKAGQILTLTWYVNNLTGKLVIGSNPGNLFFCCANHCIRLHWLQFTQL